MSLATRCPACGTVFRVVQDQLKVSDGWVRCGRCAEVFNAAQRLFELDAGSTQAAPPQRADAAPARTTLAPRAVPPAGDERPADAAPAEAPPADAPSVEAPGGEASDVEAPSVEARAPTTPADAATAGDEPAAQAPAGALPDSAAQAADGTPTPGFVHRADRAARWHRPARRGLLAGMALLLALLLAAQLALHYRDAIAAHWPATRPALQAACGLLGCRIEAPRRIDALQVDSSGLVRLPDSTLHRLSLVLQNKAATPVRMPAVELVLTDTQGHAVVRRVLTAAELGQDAEQLPPGGELLLQATLDLGQRRVAGYTVELFYP